MNGANKYPQALSKSEECRLRTQITTLTNMAVTASTTGQILAFSISSATNFLFGNLGTPPGKPDSRGPLKDGIGGKFPGPDGGGGGGRLANSKPPFVLKTLNCIQRV